MISFLPLEIMLSSSGSLLLNKISHLYSRRQTFSLSCYLLHPTAFMCFLKHNHLQKLLCLFNQPVCKTGWPENINRHYLVSKKRLNELRIRWTKEECSVWVWNGKNGTAINLICLQQNVLYHFRTKTQYREKGSSNTDMLIMSSSSFHWIILYDPFALGSRGAESLAEQFLSVL